MPESKPVEPTQPDRAQYGPADLHLFKTYNRDKYLAEFGVQAPKYNPEMRIKRWWDSTVDLTDPHRMVVYNYIGSFNGEPKLLKLELTAREASTINLPGKVDYLKYTTWLQPTKHYTLFVINGTEFKSSVNPEYVVTHELAKSLAAAIAKDIGLQAIAVLVPDSLGLGQYVWDPADPRRVYNIQVGSSGNQTIHSAGALVKAWYGNGVGAPGKWTYDKVNGPQWVGVSEPTGEYDARPEYSVPTRSLLPTERLAATPFGVVIQRTDKPPFIQEPVTATGPELTQILRRVDALNQVINPGKFDPIS